MRYQRVELKQIFDTIRQNELYSIVTRLINSVPSKKLGCFETEYDITQD